MDFDKEIEQHILWRSMVESLFNKEAKDFSLPAVISDDHFCHLGKWIHSKDSELYSDHPVFETLCVVHKQFHQTAAKILNHFKKGEDDQAIKLESEFYLLSDDVIHCLQDLKSQ